MNIVLSTTVLASVLAPAYSFSYLDSLGGGAAVAPPASSNGASYLDALNGAPVAAAPVAAEPVAAAPVAAEPYVPAATAPVAPAANYHDSLSTGATEISGPGIMTHADTLNTGANSLLGGAGIITHASSLLTPSALAGGAGIQTHCDSLSPSSGSSVSYNPFGSASVASASFSGSTSADGVSFTLETGDISGLVADIKAGAKLRLTGSIDSISYN